MKIGEIIRRIHLWAGVLLGIQVFLWMASGVVMSWFHLDLVRGERTSFEAPPPELEARNYATPGGIIVQSEGATAIKLRSFLGNPVYEVETLGVGALFDAVTGEKVSPIDEASVREIVEADFVGDGDIENVALLEDPPHEYRGARPVWRADFGDALHTRIYVSPDTGKIISRRNDIWRLYDFFWMLHIMDYDARTNFNNPLVKAASAAGLIFAVTGLVMLFLKTGRRQIVADVRFLTGRRRKK